MCLRVGRRVGNVVRQGAASKIPAGSGACYASVLLLPVFAMGVRRARVPLSAAACRQNTFRPKESMQQFAEDVLVPRCLAKDRRQRSIADLPLELAEKARTKYHLLLMPLEALASVTSRLSRMRRNCASYIWTAPTRELERSGARAASQDTLRGLGKADLG
jgi:hypothetical protein